MSLVERALQKLQLTTPRASIPESTTRVRVDVKGPGFAAEAHGRRPSNGRLVEIDPAALQMAGLLPPAAEERQLGQQYRRIKRPLIANAIGRTGPRAWSGHLILIASAMPGEGKTFTALNLALSMSLEKDVHVVLVDADVAKPHISRVLGLEEAPGLLDVLRDETLDVEQLILPTSVLNLSILPAGTASAEATELLASARMEQVVQALGAQDPQRIVLFDSPPLLRTTESHVLTQVAGQIVVVVRAEFTPQPVLLDALKMLEGHKGVSLVLNQSTTSADTAYYYYGYGERKK